MEGEFAQIWQRVEADLKAGRLDEDDKGKDEDDAEVRVPRHRRAPHPPRPAAVGDRPDQQHPGLDDELANAMRAEAGRYPGQEKQVLEFFRNNPQAVEGLRAPIFEEKVVDFVLELAKVTERNVAPEELSAAAAA